MKSEVAAKEWKLLEKCLHHADKNQEVYRRAVEWKDYNPRLVRNSFSSSDSREAVVYYNHEKWSAQIKTKQVLQEGIDADSASSMISDPFNDRVFDYEASQSPIQKAKAHSVATLSTTKQTPVIKPQKENKQLAVTLP